MLLSHIPLWSAGRFSGDCDNRKRGRKSGFRITPGRGSSYQNVLDEDLTQLILSKIKPDLVLSGDGKYFRKTEKTNWFELGFFFPRQRTTCARFS